MSAAPDAPLFRNSESTQSATAGILDDERSNEQQLSKHFRLSWDAEPRTNGDAEPSTTTTDAAKPLAAASTTTAAASTTTAPATGSTYEQRPGKVDLG